MGSKQSLRFNEVPDSADASVEAPGRIPLVNGHIHTPYSFSAFDSIEQAFKMAQTEGISVLGINDFYTTDGYDEFASMANKFKILPLFNIEFMALQQDLQEQGIRVNDPVNPGRTYFCGKALRYPVSLGKPFQEKMDRLQLESNRQTCQMVEKLNLLLAEKNIAHRFDPSEIKQRFAKNLLRERHIAQAVRVWVFETKADEAGRLDLLSVLFGGKKVKSPVTDLAAIENEIRANLLKAGGSCFVEEDPRAFLSLDEVIEIVAHAGGIPCYPVLLDDASGCFTDFEADRQKLYDALTAKNDWCIELIPARNNPQILKDFVRWFHQKGFLITFGTEHNTSQLDPMNVCFKGGGELDNELKLINYEGAALLAAHQYLAASGERGYLNGLEPRWEKQKELTELGKALIANFTKK